MYLLRLVAAAASPDGASVQRRVRGGRLLHPLCFLLQLRHLHVTAVVTTPHKTNQLPLTCRGDKAIVNMHLITTQTNALPFERALAGIVGFEYSSYVHHPLLIAAKTKKFHVLTSAIDTAIYKQKQ